ncbi:hypothetical protein Tcan_01202, partial [Toxocara canis]
MLHFYQFFCRPDVLCFCSAAVLCFSLLLRCRSFRTLFSFFLQTKHPLRYVSLQALGISGRNLHKSGVARYIKEIDMCFCIIHGYGSSIGEVMMTTDTPLDATRLQLNRNSNRKRPRVSPKAPNYPHDSTQST